MDSRSAKTINYHGGVVRFRIPADWCEEFENADWGTFHPPGDDTGTLRLKVITMEAPAGKIVNASTIAGLIEGESEKYGVPIVQLRDGVVLIRYDLLGEDGGRPLTIRYWQVWQSLALKNVRIVLFSYTLPTAQLDEPSSQDELALIDREVRRALTLSDSSSFDYANRTSQGMREGGTTGAPITYFPIGLNSVKFMGIVYRTTKSIWRMVVPKSFYRHAFNGKSMVSRGILAIKGRMERSIPHDELYDEEYFKTMDAEMAVSARGIAESLLESFPSLGGGGGGSALDVGCGNGAVLSELKRLGLSVAGLEYADAAVKRARARGIDVHKFDIENDGGYDQPADVVISTEVAEHLPESCADRYVDLMTRLSKGLIVMTAATPGQGGTDHVNEQPNAYWIHKLESRGFRHQLDMTNKLRRDWNARGVDRHRSNNVMVFQRGG